VPFAARGRGVMSCDEFHNHPYQIPIELLTIEHDISLHTLPHSLGAGYVSYELINLQPCLWNAAFLRIGIAQ